jgi:hypothetical protein
MIGSFITFPLPHLPLHVPDAGLRHHPNPDKPDQKGFLPRITQIFSFSC